LDRVESAPADLRELRGDCFLEGAERLVRVILGAAPLPREQFGHADDHGRRDLGSRVELGVAHVRISVPHPGPPRPLCARGGVARQIGIHRLHGLVARVGPHDVAIVADREAKAAFGRASDIRRHVEHVRLAQHDVPHGAACGLALGERRHEHGLG
jgi:hypothetical protein